MRSLRCSTTLEVAFPTPPSPARRRNKPPQIVFPRPQQRVHRAGRTQVQISDIARRKKGITKHVFKISSTRQKKRHPDVISKKKTKPRKKGSEEKDKKKQSHRQISSYRRNKTAKPPASIPPPVSGSSDDDAQMSTDHVDMCHPLLQYLNE